MTPDARALLESAPDALIVVDDDGRVRLANNKAESLFGYPRAELVGGSVDMLVPAALRGTHARHRGDFARAPSARPMGVGSQMRAVRKDGSEFLAEVSLSPIDHGGTPLVIATIRDLTERQRIEAALQTSAITLESIGDAVVSTDEAGRVVLMNRRAEELTGWRSADAKGLALDDVLVISDETTGRRLSPTAMPLGDFAAPLLLHARDGAVRPISDSVARITSPRGDERGVVLVFRDVTEARRAEALARRSRQELQQIIDKMPEGVLISAGPFVAFANPALGRCLGYAPEELTGQRLDGLVALEDRARLAALLTPGVDEPSGAKLELRFVRKDGSHATLALTPVQEITFEGRPSLLTVTHDVTEQRALQAQVILADRLASIGMLAAGLAHEINNPLTAIIANLDFALHAAGSPAIAGLERIGEQLMNDLRDAHRAATRVRDIVRDVKVLSYASEDLRGPVDVHRVLDAAARIARAEYRHRARVATEYGHVPPVMANESRLGQVFLNLIVNAFQAIRDGASDGEVRLRTRADATHATIEVVDNGEGMSPEVLARIFTPFFTTKPIGVGSGLGLSICQVIVVALGGELTATSAPGAGSIFRVRLPLAPARSDASPENEAQPLRRARVLVVDDEPLIGRALERTLSEHDVTVATSGAEALRTIAGAPPFDVLVCDMRMPGMTGPELYVELSRSHPDLARRTFFMSGGTLDPRVRDDLAALGHPCLEKPLDMARVRALIRERLDM